MPRLISSATRRGAPDRRLAAVDVDTRTDIYSLGVILYELLVGVLPFEAAALRRAAFGELARIIREQEPVAPSTKLESAGDGASTIVLRRRTTVGALRQELRGDLDWITLKALEKERTRRYATVSELAADIERHLGSEPVLARPPSVSY